MLLSGGGKSADARADEYADFVATFFFEVEAGIAKRLPASMDAELDEAVGAAQFFWRGERGAWVEIPYFSRDLAIIQRRDVEHPRSLAVMRPTLDYIDAGEWEHIEEPRTYPRRATGQRPGQKDERRCEVEGKPENMPDSRVRRRLLEDRRKREPSEEQDPRRQAEQNGGACDKKQPENGE